MTERVADLAFRARALAQAHPLSETAFAYRSRVISVEHETQPMPEFAEWAATAFLVGYCVRRVEEADADLVATPRRAAGPGVETALAAEAARLAEALRQGSADARPLLDADVVESVLDAVIASEIAKRAEHWRDQVSVHDWEEFESYVAWWVVHGYAFRTAEASSSSERSAPSVVEQPR